MIVGSNLIPNDHKIFQMAIKYTKWPKNMPTPSIAETLQNFPKLGFWV
jgi:hypothetical protein